MKPQYWIVKGRPDRNELAVWLDPGKRGSWSTRAAPRGWRAGDRVFFWEAAPKTQVVGLGQITSVPKLHVKRGSPATFKVQYQTPFLDHPIHISLARRQAALKNSVFLKSGAAGTLFRLSIAEAAVLYRLVVERNASVAPLWPSLRKGVEPVVAVTDVDEVPSGVSEGRKLLMLHYARERDRTLRRLKIEDVSRGGTRPKCEVCNFDFEAIYGDLGEGFCEVHHLAPLARSTSSRRTLLGDLAVVCSNCHRMLHRGATCRSIASLKKVVLEARRRSKLAR